MSIENSRFHEPIAKPEWLDDGIDSAIRIFKLARAGKIPRVILDWMLVTACMRVLRAVYGDDLTTVLKLRERVMESEQARMEFEQAIERGDTEIEGVPI